MQVKFIYIYIYIHTHTHTISYSNTMYIIDLFVRKLRGNMLGILLVIRKCNYTWYSLRPEKNTILDQWVCCGFSQPTILF
jgi:hypothetical protein